MNVWTYWEEGDRHWDYIDTCLDTMRYWCEKAKSRFVCVTPETVSQYVPDGALHMVMAKPNGCRCITLTTAAVRARVFQAAILATHGGLWLDADTVMLRQPRTDWPREATVLDAVFATYPTAPGQVIPGYIHCPKGSRVAAGWLRRVNDLLAEENRPLERTTLGEECLTAAIDEDSPEGIVEVSHQTFWPIDAKASPACFFTPADWPGFTSPATFCFGLSHSWMIANRPDDMAMSAEEMAKSPLLIHRLLTDAREAIKQ